MKTREFKVPKLVTSYVIQELENLFNKEVPRLFYNVEVEDFRLKVSVPDFLENFLKMITVNCVYTIDTHEGLACTYDIFIPEKNSYKITYISPNGNTEDHIESVHYYDTVRKVGYIMDIEIIHTIEGQIHKKGNIMRIKGEIT